MGYYVEVPENKGKARQLAVLHGATILAQRPEAFEDVPDGQALICVVDNGPFEAAALCYSAAEFEAFARPDDVGPDLMQDRGAFTEIHLRPEKQRPRTWVTLDKATAHKLADYEQEE